MTLKRGVSAILAAILALVLVPLVIGCSPDNRGKQSEPALDDVEIGVQVDKMIAEYLESLALDDREVIFSVDDSVSKGVVTLSGETSDESLKKGLIDRVAEISGITLVDKIEVLPAPSMGEKVFGIVKVPVVNLGDGPRSSGGSHTVTQARMGDVLRSSKRKTDGTCARCMTATSVGLGRSQYTLRTGRKLRL
ncbi:MAG: hypothetical protein ACOX4B_06335 [Bacillota bacterium]|jgi:hypothetical protein